MSNWIRARQKTDRIVLVLWWATVTIGIIALLLVAVPAFAKHTQPWPLMTSITAGCLDQELVEAIVQENDETLRQTMWNAAKVAGACRIFRGGIEVMLHGPVAELIWGGDGEETLMFVVETYDSQGVQVFTWAPKARYLERLKATGISL